MIWYYIELYHVILPRQGSRVGTRASQSKNNSNFWLFARSGLVAWGDDDDDDDDDDGDDDDDDGDDDDEEEEDDDG